MERSNSEGAWRREYGGCVDKTDGSTTTCQTYLCYESTACTQTRRIGTNTDIVNTIPRACGICNPRKKPGGVLRPWVLLRLCSSWLTRTKRISHVQIMSAICATDLRPCNQQAAERPGTACHALNNMCRRLAGPWDRGTRVPRNSCAQPMTLVYEHRFVAQDRCFANAACIFLVAAAAPNADVY